MYEEKRFTMQWTIYRAEIDCNSLSKSWPKINLDIFFRLLMLPRIFTSLSFTCFDVPAEGKSSQLGIIAIYKVFFSLQLQVFSLHISNMKNSTWQHYHFEKMWLRIISLRTHNHYSYDLSIPFGMGLTSTNEKSLYY